MKARSLRDELSYMSSYEEGQENLTTDIVLEKTTALNVVEAYKLSVFQMK